jgi:hypothetical protein
MSGGGSGYNERAWAIDLISEINAYCTRQQRKIRRGGGERTLRGGRVTRFPDVLLFDNAAGGSVLHGWELKFPGHTR